MAAIDPKREDLPRISADTIQDWQRVKSNYKNALVTSVDDRLAAQGLSKERELVLLHLDQYIDNVFKMAKPNLRVNGRNFEDFDGNEEEIEPFDEALDRHIWSLSDQRLKWDREIARTRTEKPQEVEAMLRDLFDRQYEATSEDVDVDHDEKDRNVEYPLEQQPLQIEHVFQKTTALSEELKQFMPVQYERSTRIKTVSREVKALKS